MLFCWLGSIKAIKFRPDKLCYKLVYEAAIDLKLQLVTFANKLTFAGAWDSESNFAVAIFTSSRCIPFLITLSFKSSLNWDETAAGTVAAE